MLDAFGDTLSFYFVFVEATFLIQHFRFNILSIDRTFNMTFFALQTRKSQNFSWHAMADSKIQPDIPICMLLVSPKLLLWAKFWCLRLTHLTLSSLLSFHSCSDFCSHRRWSENSVAKNFLFDLENLFLSVLIRFSCATWRLLWSLKIEFLTENLKLLLTILWTFLLKDGKSFEKLFTNQSVKFNLKILLKSDKVCWSVWFSEMYRGKLCQLKVFKDSMNEKKSFFSLA